MSGYGSADQAPKYPLGGATFGIDVGRFRGDNIRSGFEVGALFKVVHDATISAKVKIGLIAARRSAISIGDMFEMQMLMNHLSQLSEMASNVVAAANSAIMTMARNVKG